MKRPVIIPSMNPYFLAGVVLAALIVWVTGSYFFWRINRKNRSNASGKNVQPVFRLAEQWVAESQKKIEDLVQRSEQPLSAAQNELLELRLEAGRLPQGIKSLKLVRESLNSPLHPAPLGKGLFEIAKLYLDEGDYRFESASLVHLKTSLGEMPCLAAEGEGPLTEASMKTILSQTGRLEAAVGGFLYFGDEDRYKACLENQSWMEGLKAKRLMVMDFKGLTALLISLRISKDVERVAGIFEKGVQSTAGLTGQSERMNEALSALSAHSLKVRTVMEGNPPSDLKTPL